MMDILTKPDAPGKPSRARVWLATVDLARILAASLFVAVLVLAYALWSTFGLLPGAVGLVVPFAIWYTALNGQRVDRERREHALQIASDRSARAMTRPNIPTRAPLDEGGELPVAPWTPSTSYGGE